MKQGEKSLFFLQTEPSWWSTLAQPAEEWPGPSSDHFDEQVILMSKFFFDEQVLLMSKYFWWASTFYEQVILMRKYFLWASDFDEQVLLMSNAWDHDGKAKQASTFDEQVVLMASEGQFSGGGGIQGSFHQTHLNYSPESTCTLWWWWWQCQSLLRWWK